MKAVNLLPDGGPKKLTASAAVARATGGVPAPTLAIAGGLVLALVATLLYVTTANGVTERRAEIARVEARAAAAEARARQLKPYGDFAQMAAQRVETVSSLARSRFDWEQVLRDLSRAIPADVTLAAISGTVAPGAAAAATGGTGGPGAGSLRSSLSVPAVELSGCTTGQNAVARLMSRLRTVQGATRVSLARSDKDRGGGSAGGAGVTGTGGPCGRGDKPTFDLVVFFENDAVAAPPAGGSAAAPAAGAAPQTAVPQTAASQTAAPAGQAGAPASPGTAAGTAGAPAGTSTTPTPTPTPGTAAAPAATTQGVSDK